MSAAKRSPETIKFFEVASRHGTVLAYNIKTLLTADY